ncbi:MAG: hypothetical protein IMW86_00660 [Hydrogenibacillus sp.]|nr:hypothetical protein [Hydrogenibacillus sp.]
MKRRIRRRAALTIGYAAAYAALLWTGVNIGYVLFLFALTIGIIAFEGWYSEREGG